MRLSCCSKVHIHSDVLILQSFKRPSPLAVIICIPRDKNSAFNTDDSWPSSVYYKNRIVNNNKKCIFQYFNEL